jgi:DNA-binding transcriptional LysR family regulator
MPSTDRLVEFAQIVAEGSIAGAARSLGLPRATLSRRLSGLEDELGVRLMHRQTRRLVLTEAGEELHRRAVRLSEGATEAWEAVRRLDGKPRGLLRVSVASGLDPTLFLSFMREYPEVSLEVLNTTRHVDLISEGVDVAVRFGSITDASLFARRIARVTSVVVTAPSYLQRRGEPTEPGELVDHECVRGVGGNHVPLNAWPLREGGAVEIAGRLVTNEAPLMHASALRGEALALLPYPVVSEDLKEGRLVPLMRDRVGGEGLVSLVYADREFIDPKVRAFVDHAAPLLASWFEAPSA